MLLGQRIKALRQKNNLTQEDLGKKINVTKVSICCYENDTRTPTLETLMELTKVFNVDINYLIGNDYNIAEEGEDYTIPMSKEEVEFIKTIRSYDNLYKMLISDPKRFVELINKKIG